MSFFQKYICFTSPGDLDIRIRIICRTVLINQKSRSNGNIITLCPILTLKKLNANRGSIFLNEVVFISPKKIESNIFDSLSLIRSKIILPFFHRVQFAFGQPNWIRIINRCSF